MKPSKRWYIVFAIIAALLVACSAIAFWGLVGSDWLYGTYKEISPAHWDRIAALRDQLVKLDIAPAAVMVLEDALLLPHPSTEQVVFDLEQAALALHTVEHPAARAIQTELLDLAAEIRPGSVHTPTPYRTPTPAPFDEPPIA